MGIIKGTHLSRYFLEHRTMKYHHRHLIMNMFGGWLETVWFYGHDDDDEAKYYVYHSTR